MVRVQEQDVHENKDTWELRIDMRKDMVCFRMDHIVADCSCNADAFGKPETVGIVSGIVCIVQCISIAAVITRQNGHEKEI